MDSLELTITYRYLIKFVYKIIDLIVKREKIGVKKENSRVANDEDDATSKDSEDDTKGNTKFSNTQAVDKLESKSGIFCKRPIIFICDDAYSKGLRPLKKYCHNFKLEKNEEALVERLKFINKEEVKFPQ